MDNLTKEEAQGINSVCPMASKFSLGERIQTCKTDQQLNTLVITHN